MSGPSAPFTSSDCLEIVQIVEADECEVEGVLIDRGDADNL